MFQTQQAVDGPGSELRHLEHLGEDVGSFLLDAIQQRPRPGQLQFVMGCGETPTRFGDHTVQEQNVLTAFRLTQAQEGRGIAGTLGELGQVRLEEPMHTDLHMPD